MGRDERRRLPVASEGMARGPQLRVSVSKALKEHVEDVARENSYPSASEFVREAILFRLVMLQLRGGQDAAEAEEVIRRLMEDRSESPRAR